MKRIIVLKINPLCECEKFVRSNSYFSLSIIKQIWFLVSPYIEVVVCYKTFVIYAASMCFRGKKEGIQSQMKDFIPYD